jgi:hypothetical protein
MAPAGPPILKTFVAFGSAIHKVDTIEHEGKLWLVPHWLDSPSEGVTRPNRIIRPVGAAFAPYGEGEFVLEKPVPKELLARETPKAPLPGYEVRELPDIRFPLAPAAPPRH